jgi:hypothetical protein
LCTKEIIFSAAFSGPNGPRHYLATQHQHGFFLSLGVLWSAHQVFSNGDERAGKMSARILSAGALTIFSLAVLTFFSGCSSSDYHYSLSTETMRRRGERMSHFTTRLDE